jgi:hypothetical protein
MKIFSGKAPHVPELFSDTDLDTKIDSIVYGWARRFPLLAEAHIKSVELIRQYLDNNNAMSKGKNMLMKAMIPEGVFGAIERNYWKLGFPRNWADHPKFMGKLLSRCQKFCVNTSSVPDFGKMSDRWDLEDDFDHAEAEADGVDNRGLQGQIFRGEHGRDDDVLPGVRTPDERPGVGKPGEEPELPEVQLGGTSKEDGERSP